MVVRGLEKQTSYIQKIKYYDKFPWGCTALHVQGIK